MNKHVAVGDELLTSIQSFVARYPFPLDPFQLEAIDHLARGISVGVVELVKLK